MTFLLLLTVSFRSLRMKAINMSTLWRPRFHRFDNLSWIPPDKKRIRLILYFKNQTTHL
jgi:hypothetical protein